MEIKTINDVYTLLKDQDITLSTKFRFSHTKTKNRNLVDNVIS